MSTENATALVEWVSSGGPRPKLRPDGVPTRIDLYWYSAAEKAIYTAMGAVEKTGASPALTEAVALLAKAQARVADHIEAVGV